MFIFINVTTETSGSGSAFHFILPNMLWCSPAVAPCVSAEHRGCYYMVRLPQTSQLPSFLEGKRQLTTFNCLESHKESRQTHTSQSGLICFFICCRFYWKKLQPQHRRLPRPRVPERRHLRRRCEHLQLPVQAGVHRLVSRD